MKKFLTSNSYEYRFFRTIVQGVIGVIISNLDLIFSGMVLIAPEVKAFLVALVMAVLSPLMALLGGKTNDNDEIR